MARIRTIKPEFWTDEDMAEVSEAACLLAIGLLNYADDEGYFNANPKLIKAAVFPIREPSVSIPVMLRELSNHGYLSLFSTPDNKHFGLVKNFARHQVVNKPRASKIRELQLVPYDYGNATGGLPLGMDQGSGNGKEELSLAGAGVRENSPHNPVVANQIIDNRPPSTGGIGLTGKFTMFNGWRPDDDFLLKAAQWGLVLTEPPQETVLAEFITYWKAEGKAFHHVQWERKFSQSLKYMQARRKPTGDTGKLIYTDQPEAWLKYVSLITDVNMFDDIFRDALAWRLGGEIAMQLTGNGDMGNMCRQMYMSVILSAGSRSMDESQEPQQPESEFTMARLG